MKFPKTKKKYGQHFLYDLRVLKKIIEKAEVSNKDIILEIGAGTGLLTKLLVEKAKFVHSFEVDKDLYELTKEKLKDFSNLKLYHQDFLKWGQRPDSFLGLYPKELGRCPLIKVVANIPYNLTSPIVDKLAENKKKIDSIYLLVQKELAERMVASPRNKNYCSFSIFCQYHFDVKKLFRVSPKCFHPWPKVDSQFISLIPRKTSLYKVLNEELFFRLVKAVFWGKRKMVKTSLLRSPYTKDLADPLKKAMEKVKFSLDIRANEIRAEDLACLTNKL